MFKTLIVSLFVLFSAFSASCVKMQGGTPLGPKASFVLNCPRKQISYVKLSPKQYGARGCGRRATFIYMCGNHRTNCQWIKN